MGLTNGYFPALYEWLKKEGGYEISAQYLNEFTIPEEFNPAGKCHRAPRTTSTSEAIRLSLGGLEQEVLEAVEEERYGFKNGWISSLAFDKLIDERKDTRRIPRNKRRAILFDLGYVNHPLLPNGRVNNMIPKDGGKPVLYLLSDHPARS